MYNGVSPIRLFKAARDVSNHCPDWFCGFPGRYDDRACAARARADRQYFFRPAPRPPGSIPRGNAPSDDEEDVPELPRGRLLPTPNRPLPPGQGVPPPERCNRSRWRPARHHRYSAEHAACRCDARRPTRVSRSRRPARTRAGFAAGQRQPKGVPQSPPTLQPGDEVVSEPPAQKIVNKKASFSGLDKITGRIINFDEDIGETVQFGALRVKTDACYTRPATEAANTDAFVEVDEITLQGEVKRIFSGWVPRLITTDEYFRPTRGRSWRPSARRWCRREPAVPADRGVRTRWRPRG